MGHSLLLKVIYSHWILQLKREGQQNGNPSKVRIDLGGQLTFPVSLSRSRHHASPTRLPLFFRCRKGNNLTHYNTLEDHWSGQRPSKLFAHGGPLRIGPIHWWVRLCPRSRLSAVLCSSAFCRLVWSSSVGALVQEFQWCLLHPLETRVWVSVE